MLVAAVALFDWSAVAVAFADWSAVAVALVDWSAVAVALADWSAVALALADWSAGWFFEEVPVCLAKTQRSIRDCMKRMTWR